MTSIPVLPGDSEAGQLHAALQEAGAVIVENFLAPQVLRDFNHELEQILAAEAVLERDFTSEAVAAFFGENVTHVAGLAGKSSVFVEQVLCHPTYMAACDEFLLPNCNDYQLNIAHVMEREPGCEAQFIHRDAWVWKRMPPSMGEIQLASIIALSDFSGDNGGTLIVPGSHRWEGDRYPEAHEIISTEMSAGSAVLYLGNTYHGGGGNVTSADVRRGVHVSYALGWLRTEENQCLATPLERVRRMPLRAQQLLGFGIHDDIELGGGYLGTVELEPPYQAMLKEGSVE